MIDYRTNNAAQTDNEPGTVQAMVCVRMRLRTKADILSNHLAELYTAKFYTAARELCNRFEGLELDRVS